MKKNVFQEDFLDGLDEIKLDDLTELDFDLDFEGNIEKDLCIQGYMVSVPRKFADVPRKHIKASKAIPLAKELCQLKEENTFVNAVIPGDFVFCDLLEAISNELGKIKLCIGTLSYSYENVEQFIFLKSKSAFDFHEQWLSQLLDKYSVINREKTKSPRGSMLWDFINQ